MRWRFFSVIALGLTYPFSGATTQGLNLDGGLKLKQAPPKLELPAPGLQLELPAAELTLKTPVQICDERAASPLDHNRPFGVKGVAADKLSFDTLQGALNACNQAVLQEPNNPRYLFQLGRVLKAAKMDLVARSVYTKADGIGYPLATHNLALIYLEGGYMEAGKLVSPDVPRSIGLFEKAADGGVTLSMYTLGSLYYEGKKTGRNLDLAAVWFHRGAIAGHAPSLYYMGWMQENNGYTFFPDLRTVRQWYQAAAEKGDAPAMFRLGYLNDVGQHGPKNYTQARLWYERAANQGHATAMNNLGVLYENGYGVARNRTTAISWYLRAMEAGSDVAEQNLLRIRNHLQKGLKGSSLHYQGGGNINEGWQPSLELKHYAPGLGRGCIGGPAVCP